MSKTSATLATTAGGTLKCVSMVSSPSSASDSRRTTAIRVSSPAACFSASGAWSGAARTRSISGGSGVEAAIMIEACSPATGRSQGF
ncbi:hypothetical protein [Arthrobacter sp. H14-L1]|uniref:hypothetical protein n=1 Tax=Arthrobacter sp. H14-L1 TaxID=2996697 RepID=UPI003B63E0FA